MGRSVASWSVVRPGPSPREIQALKRLRMTAAGACPNVESDCASNAAPPATAAAPFRNTCRRDTLRFTPTLRQLCHRK
jgi:hypothetical protein